MICSMAAQHEVTVIALVPDRADEINRFQSPIRDPEIERFFQEASCGKRSLSLTATTDKATAYRSAELIIIAVPTDYNDERHTMDTGAVEEAVGIIAEVNPDVPVVIRSTVPVGYTQSIREKSGIRGIMVSPEFLREGHALYDNLYPARIVVGAADDQSREAELFISILSDCARKEREREGLPEHTVETLRVHPAEAESIKLFSNMFLAARISLFNELDSFALSKGLNTKEIILGICLDPRIGMHYNNPSFGYGGYCLPKDTRQLLSDSDGTPHTMIHAVIKANWVRKQFITDQIIATGPETVGIYRLTMKAGSDSFRSSAVLDIMEMIQKSGIPVIIYEPALGSCPDYAGVPVVNDLNAFKQRSSVILANRFNDEELKHVKEKVFTRDLFHRD